jgi:uncharacterized protein (TIGR02996 family)
MMNDGEALYHAIQEQPGEDTPRLAYADWLQENGNTDRAEFIRLQCEIARDPSAKNIGQLRGRSNSLLNRHKKQWKGQAGTFMQNVEFHRGFVERFTIRQKNLEKHEEHVLAVAPAPYLAVSSVEDLTRLVRNRALSVVQGFSLHETAIKTGAAEALAERDDLRNLRRLDFPNCLIGNEELSVLSQGFSRAEALEILNLSGNSFGSEGLRALCRSPWASRLKRIDISHKFVWHRDTQLHYNEPLHLPNAEWLVIEDSQLLDAQALRMLAEGNLTRLKVLSLFSNYVTSDHTIETIVDEIPSLEEISIAWNPVLGDDSSAAYHRLSQRIRRKIQFINRRVDV